MAVKEPKQESEKRRAFRWKVVVIAVGAGVLILAAALLCIFHWYGPVSSPFTDWWAEPSEEEAAWVPLQPLKRERMTPVAGEPGTWLVMVYADGDAEDLEEGTLMNVNEAELVGSTDAVKVVAQVDRYSYGYDGDGDWTDTRRYLLTRDSDLFSLGSPVVETVGEADMGDRQTLYDFATWAISAYPAEHYVLIMSDHGGGWTGGWVDYDPKESAGLSIQQIDHTLAAVRADTGIEGFELVGLEACLMGQVEVMSALAKHARYAVASESMAWETGWAWAGLHRDFVYRSGRLRHRRRGAPRPRGRRRIGQGGETRPVVVQHGGCDRPQQGVRPACGAERSGRVSRSGRSGQGSEGPGVRTVLRHGLGGRESQPAATALDNRPG
jgi:hypothetical protein